MKLSIVVIAVVALFSAGIDYLDSKAIEQCKNKQSAGEITLTYNCNNINKTYL